MSGLCHFQTHAPQQTPLFDHLVGARQNAGWALPGEVDWLLQASSARPDFSATAALRQLGQPHQKFLDKFLDLFDPVVREARLNVSAREIGTTDKIRASGEISWLRICRRTARRIRR